MIKFVVLAFLFAWSLSVAGGAAAASGDFSLLRHEETRAERCLDGAEQALCLQLDEQFAVAFGGEVRQRVEYQNNPNFGTVASSDASWLQRLGVYGDLQAGRFRAFVEFHSALEVGRQGGPSPVDENRFDLQNGFVEVNLAAADQTPVLLRAGRQELQLGSGRLVSVREGPNVSRTFDGAVLKTGGRDWRVSILAVRPRDDAIGVFDDEPDDDLGLWGVYATLDNEFTGIGGVDLYYLGFDNDNALFDQGPGAETRHSIGARFFGRRGLFDWNVEPIVQFGSIDGGDILAWTIASQTGRTFSDAPGAPRIGMSLNYASGDNNPNDQDLQTFNPLFPRGNYFSQAAVLGPYNFFNVNPSVGVALTEKITLSADINFFWRASSEDGAYAPSGRLFASGLNSDERFVAASASLQTVWRPSPALAFTAIYSRFDPKAFLVDEGLSNTIDFLEFTVKFQF